MEFDYLIVGQGLCGTLLARQLIKAGKRILVIDDGKPDASSRVAGGLINPVTGKRMVRSWLIEQLLPTAIEEYSAMEKEIGEPLVNITDIIDCYTSSDDKRQFFERASTDFEFLNTQDQAGAFNNFFHLPFGAGQIKPALHIKIGAILNYWRSRLDTSGMLANATFDLESCQISPGSVSWNGIRASGIIFCDGESAKSNPYFHMLPWSKDKGEALIVSIPGLPDNHIYRHGHISIVPWNDGLFWIGAAHDWKYETTGPTDLFRTATISILEKWLKVPFHIVDHRSSLRPANFDRKPFVGFHPEAPNVGIFNGMGGKGFSMAPYFAKQFVANIAIGEPIMADVSIERYKKILSR
jgi:glycine/D-amino acid oxidase-like deaminating enzyme